MARGAPKAMYTTFAWNLYTSEAHDSMAKSIIAVLARSVTGYSSVLYFMARYLMMAFDSEKAAGSE